MIPRRAVLERVLQRVGNQLVQNQATRNCLIDTETNRLHAHFEANAGCIDAVCAEQLLRESIDIFAEIEVGQRVGLIDLLVDERHREHPRMSIAQGLRERLVAGDLHRQEAANDLEIVLDAVVDLFQQGGCFDQRAPS